MTIIISELINKSSLLNKLIERQKKYSSEGPAYNSSYLSIPSGFKDFDMSFGLVEHGINVIASVPAMGKSALAIDIALNIAQSKKESAFDKIGTVRFLSFESTAEQFLLRLIANRSEVELCKIKRGAISKTEKDRITHAIKLLESLDFKVIDALPRKEEVVLDYIEESCNEGDVIFLDYLNLIINNIRPEPYTSGVDFVRHLKLLAINKKITFVIMSQLTKKVDERPGHRPMLSDLPYGVLANHADMIAFLLRREYYDPMDKPGMAELVVSKNRNGGIGSVNLTYRKEIVQFANYTRVHYDGGGGAMEHEMDPAFSQFSPY